MKNPYENLPSAKFWKFVASNPCDDVISDIWDPKFQIAPDDSVITLGSCFAQHISRELKSRGFNWLDGEPAPLGYSEQEKADNGYGIYSFRTGNIYTPSLLKQWFEWAFFPERQSTEVFFDDGRFYDPFRPAIAKHGYPTAAGVLDSRLTTLQAIRHGLQSANTFIFTLGLTEAWKDVSGFTYPVCPGTICGEFSQDKHFFHNFSYGEILSDMREVLSILKEINSNIRVLLTVSPVPLTATASHLHVLPATTYSKSVLRAVAGELASTCANVDYFPSYELITSHLQKGRFFEKNGRSVTREGVDYVMRHFLGNCHEAKPGGASPDKNSVFEEDVVCEDIVLENWHKLSELESDINTPLFLLIGDSHMSRLADSLSRLNIPHLGGGFMWGSQWDSNLFVIDEENIFCPTLPEVNEKWCEVYEKFTHVKAEKIVVTNIGSHTHVLAYGLVEWAKEKYKTSSPEITGDDIAEYYFSSRGTHIELVKRLKEKGYFIVWVSDPPTQDSCNEHLFSFLDEMLQHVFCQYGVVVNMREVFKHLGLNPADYSDSDKVHGNADYYDVVASTIMSLPEIRLGSTARNLPQ